VKHTPLALLVLSGLVVAAIVAGFWPSNGPSSPTVFRPPSPPPHPYDSLRTNLDDYIWPTDATRIVTSTFGEFRKTHFHGGIDIATHDRVGYRVFASRAGYVWQARVSPEGYGKILYIRHPDGYTTSYAHLDRFAPALNERVLKEQRRVETYEVSTTFGPEEFPVAKGDLIAFTGQTGIGSPHLHFEILDENLNAANPLLCRNLKIDDTIPPEVRKIAVIPIGYNSSVNREARPVIVKLRHATPAVYAVREAFRVTGTVGFAIDARDQSNGTWFRHGVYRHQLFLDDSLIFESRLDRAPMRDAKEIGLYYNWKLLAERRGRFEKLYVDTPHDLPFLTPGSEGSGLLTATSVPAGSHHFRIVSEDFNGNRSETSGDLILDDPPAFSIASSPQGGAVTFAKPETVKRILLSTRQVDGSGWKTTTITPAFAPGENTWPLPVDPQSRAVIRIIAETHFGTPSAPVFWFMQKPTHGAAPMRMTCTQDDDDVRLLITTHGLFTSPPRVVVREGEGTRPIDVSASDVNTYRGAFVPLASVAGARTVIAEAEVNGTLQKDSCIFEMYPITPGASGTYAFNNNDFQVGFTPRSTFKTIWLRVHWSETPDGTVYTLEPDYRILRDGVTVMVRARHRSTTQGLFFRKAERWSLIGSTPDSTGMTYTAMVRRTLGEVAILSDDSPPTVGGLKITGLSGRRPAFSFRYEDDLAGVDYETFKTYLDSTIVISEIDGEHHRAFQRCTDPLQRGSHLLTIHLSDFLGNATTVERRFIVR
jgi:hypothetical protein